MKFKTIKREVAGEYTRDGVTIPRTRTEFAEVPALPRDWQAIALRGAVITVLGLTLVSIAWSTYSIGELLGGGIGYATAVMFDVGWGMALVLGYLARYDQRKREFPDRLGWVLLALTMGAIFWHGWERDSIPMAVVGASVSLFAKILWIAVMKHVNADLSDDDQAFLAHQVSAAQTKAAIAQVRRQTARIETKAMIEMLAMENEVNGVRTAFGLDVQVAQIEAEEAPAIEAPALADMGKREAIRFVRKQKPELEYAEIADFLAGEDVEVTTAYVKATLEPKKPEAKNVIDLKRTV